VSRGRHGATARSAAVRLGRLRHVPRWLLRRWRRSLQLRVAVTTLVVCGTVVVLVGIILMHQITRGVLENKQRAAEAELRSGLTLADMLLAPVQENQQQALSSAMHQILASLDNERQPADAGDAGLFDVVIMEPGASSPAKFSVGSALVPASIPADVQADVREKNALSWAYGPLWLSDGTTVKGLVYGAPIKVGSHELELYYLFPLSNEDSTVALIQRTVLFAGLGLVLLVALIAVLITQQVVGPVRLAARTAERLAAGRLEERMHVHREDELALLASSFNDMADSLQEQITKLEEMSRLQRRFTSDVSHELRTPLTTIRMAADVLHGARDGFAPGVGRSAELLQDELGRFESLLADLLEISRYDAGVAALDAEPTDLRSVIRRVADAARPLAMRSGSELRIDLPAEPVVAEVDPRRVERILRNLVGNAVEHGDGQPVVIRLAGNDQAVAVTVRDHGVGLRPGEAALVFNRFWRADPSRNRSTGGTGLGLAISLEDARLHGGWLHPWGRPGLGAQFRLTLPRTPGIRLSRSPLPVVPPDVPVPTSGLPGLSGAVPELTSGGGAA
jgi:two-component system, OmpR family, sensor histidine kinase MtrB